MSEEEIRHKTHMIVTRLMGSNIYYDIFKMVVFLCSPLHHDVLFSITLI